jgi:hypothetical protein
VTVKPRRVLQRKVGRNARLLWSWDLLLLRTTAIMSTGLVAPSPPSLSASWAVVIPMTTSRTDLARLRLSMQRWANPEFAACRSAFPGRIATALTRPHGCGAVPVHSVADARRPALVVYTPQPVLPSLRDDIAGMLPRDARSCFQGPTVFVSARLSPAEDVYPNGASFMFWRLGQTLAATDDTKHVRHVMYMEPDVVPIRALWLEQIFSLLPPQADAFWAKGSQPRANGGRMAPGPQGVFRHHINGNALYDVADRTFADMVRRSQQAYAKSLVYDVALALLMANESHKHFHRYVYSDFISNFGGQPIGIVEARRRFRCSVLLHGNMSKRYHAGLGRAGT